MKKKRSSGDVDLVALLAGYNVAGFDRLFLQAWYERYNLKFYADHHVLDVMSLAIHYSQFVPEGTFTDLKFGTLCDYFGVENENPHDAFERLQCDGGFVS